MNKLNFRVSIKIFFSVKNKIILLYKSIFVQNKAVLFKIKNDRKYKIKSR